jgi:hypothetical protein
MLDNIRWQNKLRTHLQINQNIIDITLFTGDHVVTAKTTKTPAGFIYLLKISKEHNFESFNSQTKAKKVSTLQQK